MAMNAGACAQQHRENHDRAARGAPDAAASFAALTPTTINANTSGTTVICKRVEPEPANRLGDAGGLRRQARIEPGQQMPSIAPAISPIRIRNVGCDTLACLVVQASFWPCCHPGSAGSSFPQVRRADPVLRRNDEFLAFR